MFELLNRIETGLQTESGESSDVHLEACILLPGVKLGEIPKDD
jgi:hypothetical protein